jgi:hypothetical protein
MPLATMVECEYQFLFPGSMLIARTQTANETSQLQPIPRRKIWCHCGLIALALFIIFINLAMDILLGAVKTYKAAALMALR